MGNRAGLHEQHLGEAADQQSQPANRKPEIEDDPVHRLDVQHEGPTGNSKPLSRFRLSGSRRNERQKRGQPARRGTIQDIWRRSDAAHVGDPVHCLGGWVSRRARLLLPKDQGTKSANDHGPDLSHHHRLRCAGATRRGQSVRDQDRRPYASGPHCRGCRSKSMSARAPLAVVRERSQSFHVGSAAARSTRCDCPKRARLTTRPTGTGPCGRASEGTMSFDLRHISTSKWPRLRRSFFVSL